MFGRRIVNYLYPWLKEFHGEQIAEKEIEARVKGSSIYKPSQCYMVICCQYLFFSSSFALATLKALMQESSIYHELNVRRMSGCTGMIFSPDLCTFCVNLY